jgi:hypothetical protein
MGMVLISQHVRSTLPFPRRQESRLNVPVDLVSVSRRIHLVNSGDVSFKALDWIPIFMGMVLNTQHVKSTLPFLTAVDLVTLRSPGQFVVYIRRLRDVAIKIKTLPQKSRRVLLFKFGLNIPDFKTYL